MEKLMKEMILVPTDFSEVCYNAITHAVEMAKFLKFKVSVLHVINKETVSQLKKESRGVDAVQDKLKDITLSIKEKYDFDIQVISREGSIFTTISEVAQEIGSSLIVLGTHGKVGIQQHLTGSFALKVILSAFAPVIVIQKGTKFENGYKNIIFPVSTTAEVRQKVKWAVMIAKVFNSKIHLFMKQDAAEELQIKLRGIVNQITDTLDENNIEYLLVPAEKGGNFSKHTLSYAQYTKADLIMVMTNPGALNFVVEPEDEQMIFNQQQVPVMCVNPRELTTLHWFGN
ncbi:MAG: universal stress protein [Bacteroidota bacterium]